MFCKNLKSTDFMNCDVQLIYQVSYNRVINYKEAVDMNTDKIYAESLANEYAPKDTSKVLALKKLDRKAKMPANIFAYTFGIATALIAGIGMCLSMNVIGGGTAGIMVLGVVIGIAGLVGMSVNYWIYRRLLEKGKQKYSFEIIELAKQISDIEKE